MGGITRLRVAAREVSVGLARPTMWLIDLPDDRIQRDGRMVGVPTGAEQSGFLAGVTDEEDGAFGLSAAVRHLFGNLEDRDGAGSIVVRAVPDRVEPRQAEAACAVRIA